MDDNKYIEKWLAGTLTDDELNVFSKSEDFKALTRLDKALGAFRAPEYEVDSELVRVNQRKNKRQKIITMSWVVPMLRVAAVLVVSLLGYYFFLYDSLTTIDSGIAQKKEISLPDQSEVILNASSSIAYSKGSWQKKREVELIGEAYFKVAKGARFDVNTEGGVISVLGTQFNVKVRENYFEVVCYEGLVAVNLGSKNVKLPAGNVFRIINGKQSNRNDIADTAPSWLSNESSFTSVPYNQVIREFERQYDVTIATKDIDLEQLFSGRFTHSDLSLAIRSISLPLNLRYELVDDQHIVLSGD